MAKPRRNYNKNKPAWQWIIFYALIGVIIFTLLYYSGILGFGGYQKTQSETREVEYYQ